MKSIDKAYVYSSLARISKEHGVDTSRYIRETAKSPVIPESVVILLNKYIGLDYLYTYNKVYENRRKNPLYKNLVNENLSTDEKAIALSSFVTQILIHSKSLLSEGRISDNSEYIDIMNAKVIADSLSKHFNGDSASLLECFDMVREVFKKLY